ncbi:phosphonate ABC transporter ATP-binding protein [Fusobacterium sp.]|uniref:phosphonate ABC transporter ATP-binding protein n=1 Tax=Fusobacterium sp. TaxID=68766 RepID=UPI00261788AC|nr:phosphonate ABC transporter ATP-binding protein [Fusobacterium sp.]
MLEIKDLVVEYGEVKAVDNVNLKVKDGEFIAVIGSSGGGKSSLMKAINLLVKPKNGSIKIDDEEMTNLSSKDLRLKRRKIGFIFQDYNLIDRLSVIENVLTGRLGYKSSLKSLLGIFSKEEYKKAEEALKKVGLLEKAFVRGSELSGGQKQRVAIAKVLVQEPRIILADEPVASLDINSSKIIMEYFKKINETQGITVIVNIHDVNIALKYADRIVALKKGKIVFDDKRSEITDGILRSIYDI